MEQAPSLDGRRFASAGEVPGGEVGVGTVFTYHQERDLVWARYAGGRVRLGYLVGLRRGDDLEFRYTHVNSAGESATGHCRSSIEVLDDGRLRLHETWRWESRAGEGTSVMEEMRS